MAKKGEIFSGKGFIKEVFEKWFCIPEYQRPYVWGEDQVTGQTSPTPVSTLRQIPCNNH